uniref:Acid phosphatase n=1 Tax=Pholiota microspora TaxID=1538424 RepID=Q75V99_PHOMI|nr:acid phosphatase [Pholiota nameko]BAD00140.1 acid phosphatase [Pholiota nameko]
MIFSVVLFSSLVYSAQAIVPGVVFDRYVSIWLENTDFSKAAADPNFAALTKQGLQLTNFFAVTHPSEPNYVSVVGGEYFGMNNDNLNNIPANISSVVDLLEDKGITWAEYQEDMPSTGFTGFSFSKTSANDYVRKHNPLIIYDSVSTKPSRAANVKNFTLFQQDLESNSLPQWMFITPNMTNDGHDTNVATASTWAINFLTPLLKNPNFNAAKTLIVLTFDENGTNSVANRIDTIVLGSAVPASLVGTQDATYYNHYSEIATVEANWDLHTLGRYDVGANVYSFVAAKTGDIVDAPTNPTLAKILLNLSYPGPFNSGASGPLPIPNTSLVVNGRTVLPAIASTWGSAALQKCTTYTGSVNVPSNSNPPILPSGC